MAYKLTILLWVLRRSQSHKYRQNRRWWKKPSNWKKSLRDHREGRI